MESTHVFYCILIDHDLIQLLQAPGLLPLLPERGRLLREVGSVLLHRFDGQAAKLIEAAGGSAVKLVRLVAECFPGGLLPWW